MKTVRSLVCHAHVPVALACYRSLLARSVEPLSLVAHDDGTLTPEDIAVLESLGRVSVLGRREADERVLPQLSRRPASLAYRRSHPLALKLLDVPLLGGSEVAYADSDVLFLRPFSELFEWPDSRTRAVFTQDPFDSYSLRPHHGLSVPVGRGVNTGLFHLRAYDPDFIEHFLGRPRLQAVFRRRQFWVEQTAFAALSARLDSRAYTPPQFVLASKNMGGVTGETVGIHFVTSHRSKIEEYEGRDFGEDVKPILTRPLRRSSMFRLLRSDLTRYL